MKITLHPAVPPALLDKTSISTRLLLHPDLLDDPDSYIRKHDIQARSVFKQPKNQKPRNNGKLVIDMLTYKGIKMECAIVHRSLPAEVTIDFNPGVCLYGHNGRITSFADLLCSLTLLVTHLVPLLRNSGDWRDLVPGLRSGGPAYWSYLEILMQVTDRGGDLLRRFRHTRHPDLGSRPRIWDDSVTIGTKKGKLCLSIYRKAQEMVAHGKLPDDLLEEFEDVLRLEARLREDKLVEYLGNDRNTEKFGDQERIVRFWPEDLIRAHRTIFSELKTSCTTDNLTTEEQGACKPLDALGVMLARAAADPRCKVPLPHLLSRIALYTGGKTSDRRNGQIRKAAEKEMSRILGLPVDTLYAGDNLNQPAVVNADIERLIRHEPDALLPFEEILDAYLPKDSPVVPNLGARYFR